MKRKLLSFVSLIVCFGYVHSQDITISFAAQGESTTIDEVVATNLTTEDAVTLPGDEVLVLHSVTTGVEKLLLSSSVNVVPNPFSISTQLYYRNSKEQQVVVQLVSVTGQVLAVNNIVLAKGNHWFQISAKTRGLYILSLIAGNDIQSIKIIQNETGSNHIEYVGIVAASKHAKATTTLKASLADYVLNYSSGDIISYSIKSGDNTTIINEAPIETKTVIATIVTCKDYDNNYYKVVKIGDQIWMAENLKSTKYAEGTAIPLVTDNTAWANLGNNNTDKGYCFYNNNINGEKDIYGALYTYAAAVNGTPHNGTDNLQGVCPDSWHLPSDAEWTVLTDYLGGSNVAGGKLKQSGTTLWISPNTVGTNESGFFALPGSGRGNLSGSFWGVGDNSFWWTSTEGGTDNFAYYRQLYEDEAKLYRINDYKSPGMSVRCVKD